MPLMMTTLHVCDSWDLCNTHTNSPHSTISTRELIPQDINAFHTKSFQDGFFVKVLEPAGIEGDLRMSGLNNAVDLLTNIKNYLNDD